MHLIRCTLMSLFLVLMFSNIWAQRMPCASRQFLELAWQRHPGLKQQMEATEVRLQQWITRHGDLRSAPEVITIPVVVHVLWNQAVQNIPDEQILSQLDILNADFRKHNTDTLLSNHPFWPFTADVGIEFCLAAEDPLGNPTSGITRSYTPITEWDLFNYEDITFTALGGHDNWDPTRYLNLYVADLDALALGFATFPDELALEPEKDGVAIHYQAFGNTGAAGTGDYEANARGRTATHEVGHWLNLSHIWGDQSCGDDLVDDTPPHEDPFGNYDCPSFPFNAFNACGSDQNGEMFMNYMDYTNDTCMNMFTHGQAMRMLATLNDLRAGILDSEVCQDPTAMEPIGMTQGMTIFPNPTTGRINIHLTESLSDRSWSGHIWSITGGTILDLGTFASNDREIDLSYLSPGIYILRLRSEDHFIMQRVIIQP